MKPRTCIVRLTISNDKAEACHYTVRPVPAADRGLAVAAFLLTNWSKQPAPLYLVELAESGQVVCDCPQFGFAGNCKHADALAAAGLLPCALAGVLQQRNTLLAEAEAMLRETEDKAEADAKSAQAKIEDLTVAVRNLAERAQQLQIGLAARQPARSRRRFPKAKAA